MRRVDSGVNSSGKQAQRGGFLKTLALRLDLGGQQVILKGDVVYSNPGHGVGVRFHRLPDDVRTLMERELPRP